MTFKSKGLILILGEKIHEGKEFYWDIFQWGSVSQKQLPLNNWTLLNRYNKPSKQPQCNVPRQSSGSCADCSWCGQLQPCCLLTAKTASPCAGRCWFWARLCSLNLFLILRIINSCIFLICIFLCIISSNNISSINNGDILFFSFSFI